MVRSHHVARIFHPFLIFCHILPSYLDKKSLHASQWSSVKCFFSVMIWKAARPPWTNLGRRVWQLDPVEVHVTMLFQVDADSTPWEVLCKGGVFFVQSYSTLLRRWQTCRLACEFLRQLPLAKWNRGPIITFQLLFTRNWSLNLHELISEYCVLWCLGRPRRH